MRLRNCSSDSLETVYLLHHCHASQLVKNQNCSPEIFGSPVNCKNLVLLLQQQLFQQPAQASTEAAPILLGYYWQLLTIQHSHYCQTAWAVPYCRWLPPLCPA